MKHFSIRQTKAMDSQADIYDEKQIQFMLIYNDYIAVDKLEVGQKCITSIGEVMRIQDPSMPAEEHTLHFYLWDDVQALADYSSGMAFAIAASKQDAINLIMESHFGTDVHPNLAEDFNRLFNELHMNPPKIMDKPFGYTVRGGA